jgi:hypothetical protein
MFSKALAIEPFLLESGRFPSLSGHSGRVRGMELGCLFVMGTLAAVAANLVEVKLRIPGHAIVRVIFPIALGLALVPRRGSGLVMGTVGLGTSLMIGVARFGTPGFGATTSLVLSGILMDLVARRARAGWQLYGGLAIAGCLTNLAAFGLKASTKLAGLDPGWSHWYTWWPRAVISYPLSGLIAGLVCAMILFRFQGPRDES